MLFSKVNAYRFGIIISFLSALCVCDKNVSTSMADTARKPHADEYERDCPFNDWELCHECKAEGFECYQCCGISYLECFKGICTRCTDENGVYICGVTPYETASQISLSIAMALGVIILLVVLWKMCFYDRMSPFRRYSRRARARMIADNGTPLSEDVTRASVSSIQIRVVARLQNRPPRYETSYNYNQRVEAIKQQAVVDEAPPAYDAVEENVEKGPPPPYTIDLEASTRQGIDNSSFVADEPPSGNMNTSNASTSTNSDLNPENTAANNRVVIINCETVHI